MIYLLISLVLAILVFYVFHTHLDKRVGKLEIQLDTLQDVVKQETGVYEAEQEYKSLYDRRIEELKEEIALRNARVADEREDAEILAKGVYNIPEEENHIVATNRVTREVSE